MTHDKPGTLDQSIPPARHIPYLLDSYSNPPTQPRYRLGVATRSWNNESDTSSHVADVTVDYFTGDDADEDEYHTIWIINDNTENHHGRVDTWSALVSSDGNDVQTLLQIKYNHRELSYGNGGFVTPSNQQSGTNAQGHTPSSALSPYATGPSHGIQPPRPEPSINLGRGYKNSPAAPERIPGAPPFETSLPIHELADCTMEEMLSYYPEHVLHWPGLAVVYNHYRFRLTNPIFEDTIQYIRNVRGDHVDISKRNFRRATTRTGCQILNGYETGNFDGHMQPLSEAVQASGQSLEAFLESILWTPPKNVALQPSVPLSEVGSTVFNHPIGQFSSRVLAAMQNQNLPPPPNKQSYPIIKRCLHGSPEVNETMRDTISFNYYPVHLPEEFVINHYYEQLTHEPLLYVLIKYSGNAIARMVPKGVCPDQTHAGFKTFAAKLRKRQQMALGQRGERRRVLWKGMTKAVYGEAYGKLKKEYQEERTSGGYGGVGFPAKRRDYEEEEDELSRAAPSRKRRRTKREGNGGEEGMLLTNTYTTTLGQPIHTGAHRPIPSFCSMMATPMMQRQTIPWTAASIQQEMGFHAPTTFMNQASSNLFPAATFTNALEPVYDPPSFQNYDPQFDYSGQQHPFQCSDYNTFDCNIGDGPQYPSINSSFEQSQYITPQTPITLGEIDTSFNSMPADYHAVPPFFQPSTGDNVMKTEEWGGGDIAVPELTSEIWDQLINFDDDPILSTHDIAVLDDRLLANEKNPVCPDASLEHSVSHLQNLQDGDEDIAECRRENSIASHHRDDKHTQPPMHQAPHQHSPDTLQETTVSTTTQIQIPQENPDHTPLASEIVSFDLSATVPLTNIASSLTTPTLLSTFYPPPAANTETKDTDTVSIDGLGLVESDGLFEGKVGGPGGFDCVDDFFEWGMETGGADVNLGLDADLGLNVLEHSSINTNTNTNKKSAQEQIKSIQEAQSKGTKRTGEGEGKAESGTAVLAGGIGQQNHDDARGNKEKEKEEEEEKRRARTGSTASIDSLDSLFGEEDGGGGGGGGGDGG
ncbi:hypothetical protein BLS_005220 [Venturia inaequalis]|uniref:Uncharacterized protein n=1 Tax=Venturia inaequalis TaxID=5025 RepID=A0A8H3UHS1_VENIN|nr:hypothetical protein BLS_005220 [Venturia inaequalis]